MVDIFSLVDDDFPASLGIHPGSSLHCSSARLADIIPRLPDPVRGAGGGAASVAKLGARLGLEAAFAGAIGADEHGELFSKEMADAGLRLELKTKDGSTGAGIVLRCPSGLRSLAYAPGAALQLQNRDIPDELLAWADWVFVEGFLLSRPELLISLLNRAALAGTSIAFDLGSWRLVQEHRDLALEILGGYARLLFANEDEFMSLAGASLEEGIEFFRPERRDIILKRGAEGALLLRGEETFRAPGLKTEVLDETCAGDAFAAGFMAGISRGLDPAACLGLGNRVAALSLSCPGSSLDPEKLSSL